MTELPPDASPVDAIAPGTRLREWDVVGFRGRGSYGVVYEARRSSWLEEPARALKVFDPIISSAARHSLLEEFSALTSVRHPNLLVGIDAFDIDEPPFAGCVVFVLELADEDLGHRVAQAAAPPDPRAVAAIGAEVATGLAALHEMGRVHGDVKPENILRVGDRWVLGDFGLTGLLSGSYAFTPGTTIDYRPPELADAPEGTRLHRGADVWALGVTLHVAATGRHPFPGPDPMMRYASVVRGDRTPARGDLDPRLAQVIDRGCLAPDPRQRPTAGQVAEQLRAIASEPPARPDPAPQPRPKPRPSASRWFWMLLAAITSVVVAQAVALGAGALDSDLGVRRAVYVVVSLAALAATAFGVRRRWPPPRDHGGWAVAAGVGAWAVATASLFGALG